MLHDAIHKGCGGHLATWDGLNVPGAPFPGSADQWTLPDGSRPVPLSVLQLNCPKCGAAVMAHEIDLRPTA